MSGVGTGHEGRLHVSSSVWGIFTTLLQLRQANWIGQGAGQIGSAETHGMAGDLTSWAKHMTVMIAR